MTFPEQSEPEKSKNDLALQQAILDELDRLFPPKPPLPRFHYPAWILVFLLCGGILLGQGMTSLSPVFYTVNQLKAAEKALESEQRILAQQHLSQALKQSPESRVVRFRLAAMLETDEALKIIEKTPLHLWHVINPESNGVFSQLSPKKQQALRWDWPWNSLPIPSPAEFIKNRHQR